MPLFTGTQQQYYTNTLTFNGDGSATAFDLNTDANGAGFDPLPATIADFNVFFDGVEQSSALYDATPYNAATGILTFDSAPANGVVITITQISVAEAFGGYQYITLQNAVNNFLFSYVGEGKIITKLKRADVLFHAQRGLQELSFDTFKCTKSHEIEVPATLTMTLPQDYVNYVKLVKVDSNGIHQVLYPTKYTSDPTAPLQTGAIGNENFIDGDADGNIDLQAESNTFGSYNDGTVDTQPTSSHDTSTYDELVGGRYGIEPEFAQTNGSFYINDLKGRIHFSSNLGGKTVILQYISDSLGTDAEMQVHKFAEEAMYKYIAHAILATKADVPEYLVARFKKEAYASKRQAKLRLSNIKLEEITQILRGKSKHIKH